MTSDDPDDPKDAPGLVTLVAMGRAAPKAYTVSELDRGLNAVRSRLAAGRAHPRTVRLWSLLGAAAVVCLVVTVTVGPSGRQAAHAPAPPVEVSRIEGGAAIEGGYLSQSGTSGVKVLFSEGSTFTLMPGARGRLRSVARDGANLAIERGTASVSVTPERDHRWLVEAGPFLVRVTGTVFTVSWDPSSERFELRLRHGHVVISGPVVNGGLALRAGQHLIVNLPQGQTVITDEPAETAGPAPDDLASPPRSPPAVRRANGLDRSLGGHPASPLGPPAVLAPSPASRALRARGWAVELAKAHWDRILEEAERDGLDATLETASSEDLFALADAARYRRHADLARATLLAQRRRFPNAPRSLDAIFLLGRAEELRERGTRQQAITWYDEYLASAPLGAYAAEALGRKMMLTNEVGGVAEAGRIAQEYLRRFPGGSYARSARALQRVP